MYLSQLDTNNDAIQSNVHSSQLLAYNHIEDKNHMFARLFPGYC